MIIQTQYGDKLDTSKVVLTEISKVGYRKSNPHTYRQLYEVWVILEGRKVIAAGKFETAADATKYALYLEGRKSENVD